ncbi:MAG: DUF4190 domain-containing protein [Ruminococcaceae bacterium]|nr:DUF4190 domain-containing protein [Oscillospiraceae bacterium]
MEEKKMNPVAVLVLGICSLVFSGSGIIGIILAIIGLVLAKKADPEDKKVKAGKILSIIGLILSILGIIVSLIAIPTVVVPFIGMLLNSL